MAVVRVDLDRYALMQEASITRDILERVRERRCVGRHLAEQSECVRTGETRELCPDPMAACKVGERSP
jgi:hypothetical protein